MKDLINNVWFLVKAVFLTPFYLISGTFFFSRAFRSKAIGDKLVYDKRLHNLIQSGEYELSDDDRKLINEYINKYKKVR